MKEEKYIQLPPQETSITGYSPLSKYHTTSQNVEANIGPLTEQSTTFGIEG